MTFSVAYKFATGRFSEAMAEIYSPIAKAGTMAMREAVDGAKNAARENIAAAGFSKKWQNAMRGVTFPQRKSAYSAEAVGSLWHKITYASIFEEGGRIAGRPLLWVPLSSTPKKVGRYGMTPKRFQERFGRLFSVNSGRKPLLMAPVRVTAANARRGPPYRVTANALRRGAAGEGIIRAAPVFVGVRSVDMKKKINVYGALDAAADRLPALYLKHLEA